MILNVAVTGGDALERAAFARRFVPCVRHANSVFEVYRRKTPFAMGDVAAAAFSVNQLLCDAMMVNEAVRGLAHLYRPLQLVVPCMTPPTALPVPSSCPPVWSTTRPWLASVTVPSAKR